MATVIDVITWQKKMIPLLRGASFRTQKKCVQPSWRLNYGGVYVVQLV